MKEKYLNLKEIRTEKGLTIKQLSEISGVASGYISEVERGKYHPTINIVCLLCKGLEVTPNQLIIEKYYR